MNSLNPYILMFGSALLAAISQIILKSSTLKGYSKAWQEIINFRVVMAYGLLMTSLLFNIIAYKSVNYKWGPIIASTSYIYVIVLSRLIFRENLNRKKIIGSLLILLGIVIFSL